MDKTKFSNLFSTIRQIISKYREDLKKIVSLKKLKDFLNKNKKSFNLKRIKHFFKNIGKKISSYWKRVLSFICCFGIFYYGIGGILVEDTNTSDTYFLAKEQNSQLESVNTMAFLINREIDKKMWTPNLPVVFPAYILDNMPNFQVGIITSVKDMSGVIKKFAHQTKGQQENIKKAEELLRYPSHIWLMSKKGSFSLAPSANAQYRKARSELLHFNNQNIQLTVSDFNMYLKQLARALRTQIQKNDSQIIEHSSSFLDTKADDLFYKTRGYAFGAWQIAAAMGFDCKQIIIQNDVYTEWTYLLSFLKKTAEFKPCFIRNGQLDSIFAANHLAVQNYYLERALTAILQIQNKLQDNHAYKN